MRSSVAAFGLILFAAVPLFAQADTPLVPPEARLEKLWGEGQFTEGPAYGPDACIYFSDIGNRIMKVRRVAA